jgi:hypothetical protein
MTHCRCYTWSKTASLSLPPLMLPRSFTSLKLAHESALLLFHCSIHEILSIWHAGSWVSATVSTLPHPRDLQHLSCWLINLSCCPYTTLSTRFTASVMLAHESPLLNSYCHINYTHSICHAGSQISPAVLTLPVHEIPSVCHAGSWISATKSYSAVLTGFPASVQLAHESLLQNHTALFTRFSASSCWLKISAAKLALPSPRDSQYLLCWLMNLCFWTHTD